MSDTIRKRKSDLSDLESIQYREKQKTKTVDGRNSRKSNKIPHRPKPKPLDQNGSWHHQHVLPFYNNKDWVWVKKPKLITRKDVRTAASVDLLFSSGYQSGLKLVSKQRRLEDLTDIEVKRAGKLLAVQRNSSIGSSDEQTKNLGICTGGQTSSDANGADDYASIQTDTHLNFSSISQDQSYIEIDK